MTNEKHFPKTIGQCKLNYGLFTNLTRIVATCDFSPSSLKLKRSILPPFCQNKYPYLKASYIKPKNLSCELNSQKTYFFQKISYLPLWIFIYAGTSSHELVDSRNLTNFKRIYFCKWLNLKNFERIYFRELWKKIWGFTLVNRLKCKSYAMILYLVGS